MGQKDKQECLRECRQLGWHQRTVWGTRNQTCWSLIHNVFGLFLERSVPLFCPGEKWVKRSKAQQEMNYYLSTVASQGALFKLRSLFVLISNVNVIIVSRFSGLLWAPGDPQSLWNYLSLILQGGNYHHTGNHSRRFSFCPLPSVRFTSGDARPSDHAAAFLLLRVFFSWCLRLWYVTSHNTTASSTSSDSPPVLQPTVGRISLHTFDEKRKSGFVLVLPYLPLGELKPWA